MTYSINFGNHPTSRIRINQGAIDQVRESVSSFPLTETLPSQATVHNYRQDIYSGAKVIAADCGIEIIANSSSDLARISGELGLPFDRESVRED